MPWGYVAVATITGVMASEAADKADVRADKRAATLAKGQEDVLAFEQEKYDEWKSIYGDIEQNLADFYEDLTPEFLTSAGLQDEAQSFATAKTNIQTSLAQKNLGGSGLEAAMLQKQEIGSAEKRAEIRRDAPLKVAEAQQNFLAPQLAAKTAKEGNISASMQRGVSTQLSLDSDAVNRARAESEQLWSSTGDILGAGARRFAETPTANEPTITKKVE